MEQAHLNPSVPVKTVVQVQILLSSQSISMIKLYPILLLAGLTTAQNCPPAIQIDPKPQIFIMSDISNEPDDTQSFIRLLLHSDQYNITGMVATTSYWLNSTTTPDEILKLTSAYGKVVENLQNHSYGQFPPRGIPNLDRQIRPPSLRHRGDRQAPLVWRRAVDRSFGWDAGRRYPALPGVGWDERAGGSAGSRTEFEDGVRSGEAVCEDPRVRHLGSRQLRRLDSIELPDDSVYCVCAFLVAVSEGDLEWD